MMDPLNIMLQSFPFEYIVSRIKTNSSLYTDKNTQEAADAFFSGEVDVDALMRASTSRAAASAPPVDFATLDAW